MTIKLKTKKIDLKIVVNDYTVAEMGFLAFIITIKTIPDKLMHI